jgi:hypothetical protein
VNSGDMEKATGYLSSKVVQSVGVEKLQMALQYQKEAMDGMGGMKKLNLTDEQVYDKTALVKAEIEFGNGQTQNADVQLVKESGKWKIDITK